MPSPPPKPSRHWGLCLLLFPLASASFANIGNSNRLSNTFNPTGRIPSTSPSSTSTQMNLQLPWFNKASSKSDNKNVVWGDGTTKDGSSSSNSGSTTTSSPGSSNKAGLGGVAGIMDKMEMFKTAQQVGKMTNSLVQELASTTVEGVAVEGKVKVVFDGQQRPVGVQIDDTYLDDVNASDLSTALTTAMKDAYGKSSEKMDEKMKSFYVDLGLK